MTDKTYMYYTISQLAKDFVIGQEMTFPLAEAATDEGSFGGCNKLREAGGTTNPQRSFSVARMHDPERIHVHCYDRQLDLDR